MLKVTETQDPTRNLVAPSVYIDSVVIENGNQTVHYSLIDENNEWINNNQILDNLFVYISDGLTTDKRLLRTSVTANTIRNNTVSDYSIFYNTGSNISIKAWVGNEFLTGVAVSQSIYVDSKIPKSTYNSLTLDYINKIKNLDLLDFNITFETASAVENTALDSELFVSYRPDKKANLAFLFNLEKFLEQNSKNYNILKKNKAYKQIILGNSLIDVEKSYFGKRNLTKNEKDSSKINNTIEANLISSTSSVYYVSVADDNTDYSNSSYYDVDVRLEVVDYSTNFLNDEINEKLISFIDTINVYKKNFELTNNDKKIQDVSGYVFENYYETLIDNNQIQDIINTLSPICALFSGKDQTEFSSLFASLLHPLTTSIKLLERFILFLNGFQKTISSLITKSKSADNFTADVSQTNLIFEKRFGQNDGNPYLAEFNYDYEYGYGIEVIKSDTLDGIISKPQEATSNITLNDLQARKLLEARKYFGNPSANTSNGAQHLSIANLFFNDKEYNLLINLPTSNTTIYNDSYIKTKDYNKNNLDYSTLNTYVFELLYDGINIKTLSNRSNNSTNNLLKSVLFDSNRDTSAKSLKLISDTNVKSLYFALDKTSFVQFGADSTGSIQYKAVNTASTTEVPIYPFDEKTLNNPDLKAKTIVFYNSIYKLDLIKSGDLLDVYNLKEAVVNEIYLNKLRLMTGNFIVRKSFPIKNTPSLQILNVQAELRFSIRPIYLDRNISDGNINITVDDL